MLFSCDLMWNHMGNHVILFPCDFVPCDYLGNHVEDKF
jgi:hypothetical protein